MLRNLIGCLILGFVLLCFACQDETFTTSSDAKLEFSLDTLRFDTVFTTLGSATRSFRVRNLNNESIRISTIQMGNGSSSFRLNIDGTPQNSASDVEILPNDSLWIFAEVTVDPDQPISSSPFVIEDDIFFETNGNEQIVHLEAWGQNANYIPSRFSAGQFASLSCDLDSLSWDDPKPYVIYGVLVVDSCDLILPAGTEVYVHGGVARNEELIFNDGLFVFTSTASLVTKGTIEDPVLITGDRLEQDFSEVSGQWAGVRFLAGSRGNKIRNTIIENSIVGVRVDSSSNLRLTNTKIRNTASSGIIGVHASIFAENCLVTNSGGSSAFLTYGGSYQFFQTTFANYGNQASALHVDNFACGDAECTILIPNRLSAFFQNCIIFGSGRDEIELVDALDGTSESDFNYNFRNCIVAVDELIDEDQFPNFFDRCLDCINAETSDTLFVDVDMNDYHLDTMSIAENKGAPLTFLPFDLDGNTRDLNVPDIGCYEFQ